jgi:hypothetical protein
MHLVDGTITADKPRCYLLTMHRKHVSACEVNTVSSFEARRSKSAAGSRRSKLLLGQTEVEVDDRSQGGQLAAE